MKWKLIGHLLLSAALLSPDCPAQEKVDVWLTTPDRSALFAEQRTPMYFSRRPMPVTGSTDIPIIVVDDTRTFQTIDGFGFALTGGSAQLMMRMSPARRAELLRELFGVDGRDIGVSYLRVSIGASDMNDHVYSYDDLPEEETDPGMAKFSLEPDRADVIPVLREILKINPTIKILASPWSAPAWMKTNEEVKGGRLRPEYYDAYALYLSKYIAGMKAEGIAIDTITLQNEPLNDKNTPSMVMPAQEQGILIRDHAGPLFRRKHIQTKIVLYDHNCDAPDYPISILRDGAAAKYVDGSGFHLYDGDIRAMSQVHDAFPGKNLYFTEQMVVDEKNSDRMDVASPMSRIVMGATRNWSRNVLLWNLAADSKFGPHTNHGGCPVCQGAITIDGDDVTRNRAYYTLAHASKFVRPGSTRIFSSEYETLSSVAFKTQKGKRVLIVANTGRAEQSFYVGYRGDRLAGSLEPGAVATYVW